MRKIIHFHYEIIYHLQKVLQKNAPLDYVESCIDHNTFLYNIISLQLIIYKLK